MHYVEPLFCLAVLVKCFVFGLLVTTGLLSQLPFVFRVELLGLVGDGLLSLLIGVYAS
jgi:hypothetical protein